LKKKSIIGKKFNNLLVLEFLGLEGKKYKFKCKCDCGELVITDRNSLTQNDKKMCKSCATKLRTKFIKDLTGLRFGRLLVLKYLGRKLYSNNYEHYWECLCDCGNTVEKYSRALLHDKTKSCGCIQKELASNNKKLTMNNEKYINRFFGIYKWSAKKHKREFSLSLKDFNELITSNCYYCGSPPKERNMCRSKYYEFKISLNGLDRIDSKLGYTINNVRPCCETCNRMKLDLDEEEFYSTIAKIYKNLKLRNYSRC
jgi:hypothetical protein